MIYQSLQICAKDLKDILCYAYVDSMANWRPLSLSDVTPYKIKSELTRFGLKPPPRLYFSTELTNSILIQFNLEIWVIREIVNFFIIISYYWLPLLKFNWTKWIIKYLKWCYHLLFFNTSCSSFIVLKG